VAFAAAMRLYLTKKDGAPSLSRRRLFGYEFGLSDEKRGMKLFMKLKIGN
jgi:hypothetical protein